MFSGKKYKDRNAIIEALEEPAFIFEENGDYVCCNKAAREILKILGYAPNRPPEHYDAFMQVLGFTGEQEAGEWESQTGLFLGGTFFMSLAGYFDGGILLRLQPMNRNDHILRLSSSLDAMPWGLMTIDLSEQGARVVFTNAKAGEFLHVLPENMIGVAVQDVFRIFGIADNMADQLNSSDVMQYDHQSNFDGRARWFRFHFIPYRRDIRYCTIVIEDTTERKIMEGQYFQAQRLESLGQLAGGVAHDFNNILSIIDGYARIAKKTVPDNKEALDYLERITQSVQRGASLTGQLLTFGRHKVMKDIVTDLGDLVLDQESLLRPLMDASISLSINVEKGINVDIAPDNICQILLNLCINARDAMPGGGNLIIEAGHDKDRAFIRIVDTGMGMTPDIKARIFDPFFTTKDQGKGTGLGLSMVYGLVKDMRGNIEVESRPGDGSIFTIFLPLSEQKAQVQEIVEDEEGNIYLNGFTALIAEDEPDLLGIVSGMLKDMGVNVLIATNGNEALKIQDDYDGNIDFLLTDVVMPELNGVRLAELFEAVRPDSKVVFMSGYPAHGQMARVELPEDALFMPKPVDFKKLGAVMKQMAQDADGSRTDRWKVLTEHWRSA